MTTHPGSPSILGRSAESHSTTPSVTIEGSALRTLHAARRFVFTVRRVAEINSPRTDLRQCWPSRTGTCFALRLLTMRQGDNVRALFVAVLAFSASGCVVPTRSAFSKSATTVAQDVLFTPGTRLYQDLSCTFEFESDPATPPTLASLPVSAETRIKYRSFGKLPLADARLACVSSFREIGVLCKEDCFGQEFTYTGLAKGVLRFWYREYTNGMVRQPFDLMVKYDADTKVIAFREKRFAVEGLSSEGIKLRRTSQ